jgi:hypothetical protein
LENYQISRWGGGGGVKKIGFNGQFLAKIPKFCLKFFFNKIMIFKDFCRNSIEISKGGPKKTFLNLVQKIFFGPPLEIIYRKIFPGGGYTLPAPPLRNPAYNHITIVSQSTWCQGANFENFQNSRGGSLTHRI